MFEQRGSFGGLDTCNHVDFGKFDDHSLLRSEIENKAIYNRHDINAHLDELCKNKIISSQMVSDMRLNSNVYCSQCETIKNLNIMPCLNIR